MLKEKELGRCNHGNFPKANTRLSNPQIESQTGKKKSSVDELCIPHDNGYKKWSKAHPMHARICETQDGAKLETCIYRSFIEERDLGNTPTIKCR